MSIFTRKHEARREARQSQQMELDLERHLEAELSSPDKDDGMMTAERRDLGEALDRAKRAVNENAVDLEHTCNTLEVLMKTAEANAETIQQNMVRAKDAYDRFMDHAMERREEQVKITKMIRSALDYDIPEVGEQKVVNMTAKASPGAEPKEQ